MNKEKLEKLINSKIGLVLADRYVDSTSWEYRANRPGVNLTRKIEQPADLAEIISRMIVDKVRTKYKGTNGQQCPADRLRSIVDIYRVAKTYIPKISYNKVFKAVTSLYVKGYKSRAPISDVSGPKSVEDGSNLICASYCKTTGRIVHNCNNVLRTNLKSIREALENKKLNVKCINSET